MRREKMFTYEAEPNKPIIRHEQNLGNKSDSPYVLPLGFVVCQMESKEIDGVLYQTAKWMPTLLHLTLAKAK